MNNRDRSTEQEEPERNVTDANPVAFPDKRFVLEQFTWHAVGQDEPIRGLVVVLIDLIPIRLGVLSNTRIEGKCDHLGVRSVRVIGKHKRIDNILSLEDIIDRPSICLTVFDIVCADRECETHSMIERDRPRKLVFEFVIDGAMVVALVPVVFGPPRE